MQYSKYWDIDAPGWHTNVHEFEDDVEFLSDDKKGSLGISSYSKKDGTLSLEEVRLATYRGRVPAEFERVPITCGEFTGYRVELMLPGENEQPYYWRYWWVFSGNLLVLALYNCSPEHSEIHREVVDQMLKTLKDLTKNKAKRVR